MTAVPRRRQFVNMNRQSELFLIRRQRWRTNLHGRATEVTAPLFENLKQVALARISRTATRFAGGTGRSLNRRAAFGARRYATVGKFDIERHAGGDGPCAAQRLALGTSHQSKTASQHAAIG